MPADYQKLKELFIELADTDAEKGHGWNALFWCNTINPGL